MRRLLPVSWEEFELAPDVVVSKANCVVVSEGLVVVVVLAVVGQTVGRSV